MQILVIAGILFAMAAVAFALQNNVPVTVTFLLWRFDSTLAMVLLMALAAGATVIALVSTPSAIKAQWKVTRQRKQIADLERQVQDIRLRLAALDRSAVETSGSGDSDALSGEGGSVGSRTS